MLPILKKHSWAMRGKQLFSLLLVIALLLGALPLTARPAAAAGVENESSQKDGQTVFTTSSSSSNGVAEPATSHGVYQISFIDDLLWAAGNPDKNYVLTNDIDLSVQTDWIPIGTADAPFSGSFNGAGHTLTLNINQTRPQNGIYLVGLFGYVSGTVVNLTVGGTINATIYSGYVGSVAANIAGGRIINCTSNVDITVQGATGIVHAGGIAGSILNKGNPGGTIANCTNNGTINVTSPTKAANPGGDLGTGTNGSVGGILGLVTTFAKGVVTTSVNNGDITVTNGSNNVGGIVGMTSSSNAATNADITYSANKGNVTIYNIAGERAAGIIGYIKSGRIDYSYNTGNVIAYADGGSTVKNGGNGYYFGILGYANTSNLEIIYSYNASPNPLAAEIGYAKNASNLTFQNFYMAGRSEYGASDPAGTPGTTFNSAADLLTKITVTEDGANAYTSNPEGGYPLLYFEKARTLADQDYDGIIEKESIGNDLNTIYYFVQTDGSVDTQGLTVNAALTKDSTTIIENAALAALPSGDSVRVGDITYVAADGSTLYSVAMNSIPDNLWTEATITAQKDGQTVFTKTITNSNAPTMPGGLPNYPDGTLSKTYNSGPGLANDQYSVTNEDSEMVVVSETSAETFNAYVQSLLSNGFEPIAHTEIDGNIYDSLKQGSQYFYLYYTANSHQARIIQDNSTNTLLSDLDSATIGSGSTEFYLYSIDYANGIGPIDPSKHCDCGALMIVKLADNSLFVIDGGHQNQSSEAAQYGLMKFMYKITGQPYGSKINIRAWFFSHAHGDHVYMAHAFVDAYHDNLNVESVLFNTPSFQTMRSGYDAGTFLMKQSFSTNFPNAKYVKLHTGQHFSLQGVGFDVLHTHEDAVNSSGVTTITDFNDTSTVFKLTMDGKTFLMLGDVNTLVQNDMLQMYSADTLRSDIVQVAHHGYNNLASLYDVVDASLAIVPNSEVGAKDNNPVVYSGYAKPGVAVLFADPDTYKLIVKDGNVEFTAIPSYREDMDLYSVTNVTLNIGSDQTQRNVVWYSDAPTAGKVQLALRSELTGGEFPTEHQEFAAVASDTNVTGFKTNKTTITGLAANTEYVYRVGTDDGWSPIYSFKTQSFTGDFSFLFAGDPQIGSSGNVANDTAGWTNTLNKSAAAFPQSSFLITAGDQVETADTETQYNGLLSPNVLKSLALAVDVGNHDVASNAFSQHFNMPNVSSLGGVSSAGSGSGDYWYIYNNTLFMSINSNNLSAAEHSQFLQETLDAHGQDVKWKVVTFHHSIYSVANHALNDDILQRREDMAPVFSKFGIDVVFMGHDHVYTRSYMMNGTTPVIPEGSVPSSVTNPEAGQVLYITANSSSGSKHYAIQNASFPYAAVKNQENTANITKVDITGTSFTVSTYRVSDMSVVDTFTINRDTLQFQEAPTGLSGMAPTTNANADGKITGVSVGMEYKLSSADVYTPVTGSEITDLIPGTYQVRYAAKEGYHESQPVDVTVPAYLVEIGTASELTAFSEGFGTPDYPIDGNYELSADIDMQGVTFSAIGGGGSPTPFLGTFNGQGYVIRNLGITSSDDNTGLFAYLGTGGRIVNVALVNADISGGHNTGAIAGTSTGTVENSYVDGKVSGDSYTGGIVGLLHAGVLQNSSVTADVYGTRIGGLIGGTGWNNSGSPLTTKDATTGSVIRNNFVAGSVTGPDGGEYFGAVVGDMGGSSGSLLQTFRGNTVTNTVYGDGLGKLAGYWSSDSPIMDADQINYYDGAKLSTSGLPSEIVSVFAEKAAADFTQQETFEDLGWDFEIHWEWDAANNVPVPRMIDIGEDGDNLVTINASAGSGGTISPSGYVLVEHGQSQTFTFTPNENFEVDTVEIDGVENAEAAEAGEYTFENVDGEHTIDVTFKIIDGIVSDLTVDGGAITVDGDAVDSPAQVKEDAQVTVTADVPDGQRFVKWTADGLANDSYTENPFTFTMPANPVSLRAEYEDMPVFNVDLTDLTVDGNTVSGFSADKTSYTVNVPYSKTSVTVAATAADETADVVIEGGNDLAVSDNTVTVTVTAEDGETKKVYSIIVNRAAESDDDDGNGSGSGGWGGGSATPSGITLPADVGGTARFENNAVTITVPPGASEKQLTITVQRVLNTSQLVTDDDVLLSPVYEILKNFTENFSNPVTITLTFDPDLVGTNQTASIFYYDEEEMEWVEIGGETSGERITAEVDHFTKFAVFAVDKKGDDIPDSEPEATAEVTFSDIAGHWAEAGIKQAAANGIIDGYTDGTFKPNGEVTRAEFAVMMARMLNLQGGGATLAFTDTGTIGAWARQGIAQAVQAGFVKGYEDGSFRPNAQISRTEMAMMIANALGIANNTNAETPFADDAEIPAWAKAAVAAAVENGLIQGVGDNKFAPDKTATRAEATVILIRALAFVNK